jgi:thioredoxin reductase (NADPH)
MTTPTRRLAIVGSGPAGYTAGLYAARADLKPVLFEGSIAAGGALMATTIVENFPGQPQGVKGPELMASLRRQAEQFGCLLLPQDVTAVELTGRTKCLETDDGGQHTFDAVILATGASHRRLGLEHEERLTGRGVSTCATCDGAFFRGLPVAVVGGGDSAMEEALFLARFASSVTLIHRGSRLRGSKILQARLLGRPEITVRWNTEVSELGGGDRLESIRVTNNVTHQCEELDAAGLFVAIGHTPNSALVRGQLPLDADGYVQVDHPGTTTAVPGVFACGDLVDRTYRQAITAAGSGCAAALDADAYLSGLPEAREAHSPARDDSGSTPARVGRSTTARYGEPHSDGSVSDDQLSALLSSSPEPLLVDFWADNCSACRLMNPVLEEIGHRYQGRMRVLKVNVEQYPAAARAHDVASSPTLKLFVGGQSVHTVVGATPARALVTALDLHLQ